MNVSPQQHNFFPDIYYILYLCAFHFPIVRFMFLYSTVLYIYLNTVYPSTSKLGGSQTGCGLGLGERGKGKGRSSPCCCLCVKEWSSVSHRSSLFPRVLSKLFPPWVSTLPNLSPSTLITPTHPPVTFQRANRVSSASEFRCFRCQCCCGPKKRQEIAL